MKKHRKYFSDLPEDTHTRRVVSIISLVLIFIVFSLIAYFVGLPLVREFQDSPETFRAHVESYGIWGQAVMIGIMAMQVVVAVIPGEPFELAAGFIFGWFEGAILCLAGSAMASALVYLAVRKWGVKVVESFFPREKVKKFAFLQNEKKLDLLVFILFLIPGTPKDMLTYLVGLTPMKLSTFLILTSLARIPSVVSSSVTGSLTQRGNVKSALITYGITLIISLVCILWYRKISKADKARQEDEEEEEEAIRVSEEADENKAESIPEKSEEKLPLNEAEINPDAPRKTDCLRSKAQQIKQKAAEKKQAFSDAREASHGPKAQKSPAAPQKQPQ